MASHTRTAIAACCVFALAIVVFSTVQAADRTAPPGTPGGPATILDLEPGQPVRVVGTIQYDNDIPFRRDGQDDGMIGNRFQPSISPHSIATVSFRLAGNYAAGTTGSVVFSVWDVNPASAVLMHRFNVTNAPAVPYGGTNIITDQVVVQPLTAPVVGHSGSFLGGVRNTFYDGCAGNTGLNTTCDGVALTSGINDGGQGSYAARLIFTGPFIPTVTVVPNTGTAIAGTNAIFRVTGDNLPVELMTFSIDD